jgi:hypothetical protein
MEDIMRLKSWAIAALASVMLSAPALPSVAPTRVGGDLLNQCQIANNLAVIACHLYVEGIMDVLAENPVGGSRACLPADTDSETAVPVVVGWLKQHEDQLKKRGSDVVAQALAEKYPCS